MFGLGPSEMMIVGIIAVLLFGSRLPSVAHSAGKSLTEFKKGMHDVRSDFDRALEHNDEPAPSEHLEPTAPKFEPPKTAV